MNDGELAAALQERLGADRIEGLRRLSGGASRETWSFDAVGPGGTRPLILRREVRQPVTPPAPEAALLRAAAAQGVPVPGVVLEADADALGAPSLVVERIEGETIPRRILREDAFAAARPRLASQCGEILARIHRIPLDAVPGLTAQDQVVAFRDLLDGFGQPHPAFELAFRWLELHRPAVSGRAVVHGDFRNGNLVVGPDGVRAVLDWELAHIGDPMEDLGWLCVKAWRFGVDRRVGGFGDDHELFAAYERESGRAVDPDVVRWWEVLGTLKWGIMCIAQAFTHLSGTVRSVELAAIGRRVCENERDLLELVSYQRSSERSEPRTGPERPERKMTPHDVPTISDLVVGVREFLESDVMSATEGRVQFHARVAVNVLRMVERELALGPAQADAHRAALARLGVADEADLARAIRAGELDERREEVMDVVRRTVRSKLEVANPGYLEGG